MKHSKKNIVFPFLLGLMLWLGSGDLLAQKYRVAAGWRAGGGPNGISLKIVPVRGFAMEGIFGIYPLGESATLLLQRTQPIFCQQRLQVYYGAGAHYRFRYVSGVYSDPINGVIEATAPPGTNGWGLDVVAGIEVKIPVLPLAISAEVKPMVEFTNAGSVLYGLDPALGLKLAF